MYYHFVIAFVLCLITVPIVIKFGIIDHPDGSRWHKSPVALLGGIAIFISFTISVVFDARLNNQLCNFESKFYIFLAGSFMIFILGLIDDFKKISFVTKIVFQFLISIVFQLFFFKNIYIFSSSTIFISIWIVGIVNALNLIDNIDGLSAGISLIAALSIFVINMQIGLYCNALFAIALSGSCAGFLLFNFKPAKIFMGDCGSMFLGFILSTLSITSHYSNSSDLSNIVTPIVLLTVPIFDTFLVTFLRLKNKRMPWHGGKDHSSHRLVSFFKGNEKKAVLILYVIGVASGSSAIVVMQRNVFLNVLCISILVVFLIAFGILLAREPYNYNK